MFGRFPLAHNLVDELLVEGETVSEGVDEAFKAFRVVDGGDVLFTVSHQVGLELNTARLLVGNNELAHLEEVTLDLTVVFVEFLPTLDAARTFVGLENN